MANGDPTQHGVLVSTIERMPWWVQALLLVGSTFGMPVVILGFYLAQDAGFIDNPIAKSLEELKGVTIQHEMNMRELTKAAERQGQHLADEARGRQMRCVIRAQTEDEKKACFPLEVRP